MIGRTIAHYHITAAIGSGGMGEVFRCCLGLFIGRAGRLSGQAKTALPSQCIGFFLEPETRASTKVSLHWPDGPP